MGEVQLKEAVQKISTIFLKKEEFHKEIRKMTLRAYQESARTHLRQAQGAKVLPFI